MDLGSAETWSWIWLVTMVTFGIGEIAAAGSFFLAPFALGAGVAAIVSFLGAPVAIGWGLFFAVSLGSFLALRPLARRMSTEGPVLGIGSHRQIGQVAKVVEAISEETGSGFVLLGTERWRAEATDAKNIPVGAHVSVVEVRGTRLLVRHDPSAITALPDSPPTA